MPDLLGLTDILAKFSLYIGILTATGLVFVALVFRLKGLKKLTIAFSLLGLLATLFSFLLRGAALTGDLAGMYDPEILGILMQTPVGTALTYRLVGLLILILGAMIGGKGLYFSAIGGGLALWSFDHIGHIPEREQALLDIGLFLHLALAAFWIGILTPLTRLAQSNETLLETARVGHEFGKIASITVPVLILVGLYMAYFLVGSWTGLFTTAYGQVLLFKIAMVAILLGFAAINKLRIIPSLQDGDVGAAKHLVKVISYEWFVILLILAATAILTSSLTLPT